MADRKQLILKKSKELFFERGYDSVSIQDICGAIEYGRSAVYNIFSSKEEIYGYVYVEAVTILADLINDADLSESDLRAPFTVFTERVFRFYDEYTPYYTALFYFDINRVACKKIPEYLIERKKKEKDRAMEPVRKMLKKGMREKILRTIEVDSTINIYFASLLGIINSYIAESCDRDRESLKATLVLHAGNYDRGLWE